MILLVDDSPEFRNAVGQALTARGFTVAEAVNGDDAIAVFERDSPDAAVVDLNMPGMNGLEFTRHVKKARPGFPVLIITGYSQDYSGNELLSAGINGFLQKPVEIGKVVDAVETL
jgi:CheY-like chemotaxis protein